MSISENTKKQIKQIILPIIWQIIYLIFVGRVNKSVRVYYDLVFYMGIVVYFLSLKSISLRNIFVEWKKGRKFWIAVLYTLIGMIIAFGIGIVLSTLLPFEDGMSAFKVTNFSSLFAFAMTTIVLPPIAEELFYRKAIIIFDNKSLLLLTSMIGILLYASEHSLKFLGLLISSIWAIPLTISFIRYKNIYIPMTAHFICNLLMNGYTVVFMAIKLLS